MTLLESIHEKSKKFQKRIVLPEGTEDRTLRAANYVLQNGLAKIILLGSAEEVEEKAKVNSLEYLSKATVIDPLNIDKEDEYVALMLKLRAHKGLTADGARELLRNPLYLSTVMIKNGDADGEVAGAMNATGDVLRPAFQFVKTQPGINVVSGAFIMIMKDKEYGDNGIMVFADCAVHPDPNAQELAEIAVASAKTAEAIAGLEPRVAMLSFSTKGSAQHELVDKVTSATEIAKSIIPDLQIDGELQADAAIIAAIGEKKAPGSQIAGKANVLVFPSLDAGNIAYKLVQRLAHAEAVGPILQGMAAPINDLSRGCSVDDIIHMIAITSNQAAAS
jgi:phosphate acetyltransferase